MRFWDEFSLLERYDSEYHYLFKQVWDIAKSNPQPTRLEPFYHLPNITRRLLEAFLSFKHPKSAGGELYRLLQDISFDPAKKNGILRFLHTYSHGGRIEEPDHDMSILCETPRILRDVLSLLEQQDKQHYDELRQLVEDQGTAAS